MTIKLNNIKLNNIKYHDYDNTVPPVTNWIQRTHSMGSVNVFKVIKANNNAILLDTNRMCFTSDGINYTNNAGVNTARYNVIWDGTKYIATGSAGQVDNVNTTIHTSTNLINWNLIHTISGYNVGGLYASIAYSPTLNMYAYFGSGSTSNRIFTSTNLTTWTNRTHPFTGGNSTSARMHMVWYNDRFIAIHSSRVCSSTDGITWTSLTTGLGEVYFILKILDNKLFILNGQNIKTSTDGITWTTVATNLINESFIDIDYDPIKKVYIYKVQTSNPNRTFIYATKDFVTYDKQEILTFNGSGGIVHIDGTWVTAGVADGYVYTYTP